MLYQIGAMSTGFGSDEKNTFAVFDLEQAAHVFSMMTKFADVLVIKMHTKETKWVTSMAEAHEFYKG